MDIINVKFICLYITWPSPSVASFFVENLCDCGNTPCAKFLVRVLWGFGTLWKRLKDESRNKKKKSLICLIVFSAGTLTPWGDRGEFLTKGDKTVKITHLVSLHILGRVDVFHVINSLGIYIYIWVPIILWLSSFNGWVHSIHYKALVI